MGEHFALVLRRLRERFLPCGFNQDLQTIGEHFSFIEDINSAIAFLSEFSENQEILLKLSNYTSDHCIHVKNKDIDENISEGDARLEQ